MENNYFIFEEAEPNKFLKAGTYLWNSKKADCLSDFSSLLQNSNHRSGISDHPSPFHQAADANEPLVHYWSTTSSARSNTLQIKAWTLALVPQIL